MRHLKKKVTLGRKTGPRKALLKSLCTSLIKEGAIKTTGAKAKAVQEMIEPLITMGRTDSIHTLRLLEKALGNKYTAKQLMKEVSPRYMERKGGYTSIVKLGKRSGDGAEVVQLRLMD